MTSLHACFLLRQQKAFQRHLDIPTRSQSSSQGQSSSGGKSWSRPAPLSSSPPCDVNARDALGRTVLHLAAAATDAAAPEYVRMLLAHPHILINMPDRESHWTALHRALYHGNLATALILLQRPDLDVSLKDSEGYTAFDLYNSTVEGTSPVPTKDAELRAALLTWGANRNAALGHGDADDRTFPDQVTLEPSQPHPVNARLDERFAPVSVKQVAMSKLHTGVVTTESKLNLRVCGFGSGGRLGPGQHTQYNLAPIAQLPHQIVSVALGQDHTLALTAAGEVFSWGLNRFSQLGYVLDTPMGGGSRIEEPIQAIPQKIKSLKGKAIIGVAACKSASACWTETEVYTWGTNNGQLGYNRNAHPVQILPRVATTVSQPVLSVSIADYAMACLLQTHDVLCLYNDGYFRVTFPAQSFPSEINAYRPPHAVRNASIEKITSCDNMFVALSSNGELFTFSVPIASEGSASGGKSRDVLRPQRVWALRKKFSAVKDVALGAEGSIIVCTESGHVFVRSRTAGKAFKFQRIPNLQRVVRVCANSTGAFGALRLDATLEPIAITGNLLPQDLAQVQPYFDRHSLLSDGEVGYEQGPMGTLPASEHVDEDNEDAPVVIKDQQQLSTFCRILMAQQTAHKAGQADGPLSEHATQDDRHGADVIIHVQLGSQPQIPAHAVVLAARSPVLAEVLSGSRTVDHRGTNSYLKIYLVKEPRRNVAPGIPTPAPWKHPMKLSLSGCHPLTVLILLSYLYTDELLTLWDWRIAGPLQPLLESLSVQVVKVKAELLTCAHALELPFLISALGAAFKSEVHPSLIGQFQRVCAASPSSTVSTKGSQTNDPLAADTVLMLSDKDVPCHSIILRARSLFFQSLFDADEWTANRWSTAGIIHIDLKHLHWNSMRYVMLYLYGCDGEIFDDLEFITSVEELIDFMLGVMAVSNELLLDRLCLLCSEVILRRITTSNATSVLMDGTHLNAENLVRSVQGYIAQSLETFMEANMLNEVPADIIRQLSTFVKSKQAQKGPVSRSGRLVKAAMQKNADWLATEDFADPLVPTTTGPIVKDKDTKLSPSSPLLVSKVPSSPSISPTIRPQLSATLLHLTPLHMAEDEMFIMDDADSLARPAQPLKETSALDPGKNEGKDTKASTNITAKKALPGWKVSSLPRVDMKSIMAEAEGSSTLLSKAPVRADISNWRSPPPAPSSTAPSPRPSGMPWKTPPAPTNVLNLATNPSPAQTPPMTPQFKPTRPKDDRINPISPSQMPPMSSPKRPSMGPVISPQRKTSGKNTDIIGVRRASSSHSPAWTLAPVQPIVQSSSSTSGMSFVAIQQAQLEQDATPQKDKRSLKEIQEEEQARQVEEDFLKWWTAEEERLKTEANIATSKPQKKHKPPKRESLRKEGGHKASKAGLGNPGEGSSKGQDGHQGSGRPTGKVESRESVSVKEKGNRKDNPNTPRRGGKSQTATPQASTSET